MRPIETIQPDVPDTNVGDIISRQAVIQMLNTADRYVAESLKLCDTDKTFPQNEVFIVDDMYEGLEQLSSKEPEIIRCKDCKYWGKRGLCEKWDHYISNEVFYCGCAERRTAYCGHCGANMEVEHETN